MDLMHLVQVILVIKKQIFEGGSEKYDISSKRFCNV